MHPISQLLCDAYHELHKQGQVQFPLYETQALALDAIVKTVNSSYFGVERYPTPAEKAVAYLCLIIKDHPVTDGSKRLGLLWFKTYCIAQELTPDPAPYTFDQIAVAIEQSPVEMETLMILVKGLLFER
jgi:prophage maintenance system killer protein